MADRWKALERRAAKVLGGTRVLRGDDYSKSDVDVRVRNFPNLRVDCKSRKRFSHHTLVKEIEKKYCGDHGHAVLVTKQVKEQGEFVTMRIEVLSYLLDMIRMMAGQPTSIDWANYAAVRDGKVKLVDHNGNPIVSDHPATGQLKQELEQEEDKDES